MTELQAIDVGRVHTRGDQQVTALDAVSLVVQPGALVTVSGPSGSGKSTLLQLLALLDQPSTGVVSLDGVDAASLTDDQRAACRRRTFGFVFQSFHLLAGLSAWENVAVTRLLDGAALRSVRPQAMDLLAEVGLADRAEHAPHELSGGEQQRVAIARALVGEPQIVFADEPTGALDQTTSEQVIELLLRLTVERGRSLVLVTHDPALAGLPGAQRIRLRDGRRVADLEAVP